MSSHLHHPPNTFLFLLFIFIILHPLHAITTHEQSTQLQVLLSFKSTIIDPYNFLSSWNTTFPPCTWSGIKCSGGGHVISIQLPYHSLHGTITPEISLLHSLRKLSLHDNLISGSIPSSLSLLHNLRGLQLFNNRFTGVIPVSLGPVLQSIDLSNNALTGHIPLSLANLTRLIFLNLSSNQLSGGLPTGEFKWLNVFDVSYNNLSGMVPSGLLRKFDSRSFVGNPNLCGYSPQQPCSDIISPNSPSHHQPLRQDKSKSNHQHMRHRLSAKDMILIVSAGTLLLILLLILCCVLLFCTRKTKPREKGVVITATTPPPPPPAATATATPDESSGGKLLRFEGGEVNFTADELLCATAEIMGKSKYGTVYKATLEEDIDDGISNTTTGQVAVKRLREKITKPRREFEVEVNVIGRIRHGNLVALRACYLGPRGEKLLVSDYITKGSLATFLHGTDMMRVDWATRMKIIKGVTRGLNYLHNEVEIIHGNLTSTNVLIDEDNTPKISDYGLLKLVTLASSSSSNVVGSSGYRAPELTKMKKASTKTDVYSLGVIMLELLTGKSPEENKDLPQWVVGVVKGELTNEVFDEMVFKDDDDDGGEVIRDQLFNCLKLALHCVDPEPNARPEANHILEELDRIIRTETEITI